MSEQGLTGAARRVKNHARSLVRLELELAATEIKQKLSKIAAGIGLVGTALVVAFFALAFVLAAAAAGLATVMPIWAALLVMFVVLVVLAALLGLVGATLVRKGAPPVPEQALEEARLTTEALHSAN